MAISQQLLELAQSNPQAVTSAIAQRTAGRRAKMPQWQAQGGGSRVATPQPGRASAQLVQAPKGQPGWFEQILQQKLAQGVSAGVDNAWGAIVDRVFGTEPAAAPEAQGGATEAYPTTDLSGASFEAPDPYMTSYAFKPGQEGAVETAGVDVEGPTWQPLDTPQGQDVAALTDVANDLGVDPLELGSVISFETGGTFSPDQWGGAGGKYMGLIQFGPAERKKYGVTEGMTVAEQAGKVKEFLLDRGFTPGEHDIRHVYSTVLTGGPDEKRWNRKDANGTSPSNAFKNFRPGSSHYANAKKYFSQGAIPVDTRTAAADLGGGSSVEGMEVAVAPSETWTAVTPPAVPTEADAPASITNERNGATTPPGSTTMPQQANDTWWRQLFKDHKRGYMMTPGAGEAQAYERDEQGNAQLVDRLRSEAAQVTPAAIGQEMQRQQAARAGQPAAPASGGPPQGAQGAPQASMGQPNTAMASQSQVAPQGAPRAPQGVPARGGGMLDPNSFVGQVFGADKRAAAYQKQQIEARRAALAEGKTIYELEQTRQKAAETENIARAFDAQGMPEKAAAVRSGALIGTALAEQMGITAPMTQKERLDVKAEQEKQEAKARVTARLAQVNPALADLHAGGSLSDEDASMVLAGDSIPSEEFQTYYALTDPTLSPEQRRKEAAERHRMDKLSGTSSVVAQSMAVYPGFTPEDARKRSEFILAEPERVAAITNAREGQKMALTDAAELNKSLSVLDRQLVADTNMLQKFEAGDFDKKTGLFRQYVTRYTSSDVARLERYQLQTALDGLQTVNLAPVSNYELEAMQSLSANTNLRPDQNKAILRDVIVVRKAMAETLRAKRDAIKTAMAEGKNYLQYLLDPPTIPLPDNVQKIVDAVEEGRSIESLYSVPQALPPQSSEPSAGWTDGGTR